MSPFLLKKRLPYPKESYYRKALGEKNYQALLCILFVKASGKEETGVNYDR